MQVWVLYDYYDGRYIEGIYTDAGKERKQIELLDQAIVRREKANERIAAEITELKELRQPYITEAEMLLNTEREAKESSNTFVLKNIRKQRKVILRQAEHLTYSIKRKEEEILASQRMTKTELLSTYARDLSWEEYSLNDA